METLSDLHKRIVALGHSGNADDPCLTAFIMNYGKCDVIYSEEEWLRICGIFVRGWNAAKKDLGIVASGNTVELAEDAQMSLTAV